MKKKIQKQQNIIEVRANVCAITFFVRVPSVRENELLSSKRRRLM